MSETGWKLFWIALWDIFGGRILDLFTPNLVIASKTSGYFQKKLHNAIRYNTVPGLKRRPEKWPIWTKGFFCTRPFNLICQQMHPFYLLFAKMQNFINKKSEISYESGGSGGSGGGGGGGQPEAGMPPPPLPRSITRGVNYLVLPEFSALKVNKWNCKIASTHLTTKASWIFTLRIHEWHKWSPKPMNAV